MSNFLFFLFSLISLVSSSKLIKNKEYIKIDVDKSMSYHNKFVITTENVIFNTIRLYVYLSKDLYQEKNEVVKHINNQGLSIKSLICSDNIDQELSSDISKDYYLYLEIDNSITKLDHFYIPFHIRYQPPKEDDYINVKIPLPLIDYSLNEINNQEIEYDYIELSMPTGNLTDSLYVIGITTIISIFGIGLILIEVGLYLYRKNKKI